MTLNDVTVSEDAPRPFGLAVPDYKKMGISGPYFGDAVWSHLRELDGNSGLFEYIPLDVIPFPDGAEKAIVRENCRATVIYVVHSLYTIPDRHVLLGAQYCDSIVRSDAEKVHLVELFNPHYRQDARKDREPITAKLVADLYHLAGMDTMYTADPHSKQLAGFFRKFEPLPMTRRLAKRVRNNYDLSNAVVASADGGSEDRAELFANLLGLPLVKIHKERVAGDDVRVKAILGDVDGKDVYLRDDIISTGGTTIKDAAALREQGANLVYNVSTHLELCGGARERLREHDIRVVGTNSVPQSISEEESRYIDVVDISDIIANVIYTKARMGSLRGFFRERE